MSVNGLQEALGLTDAQVRLIVQNTRVAHAIAVQIKAEWGALDHFLSTPIRQALAPERWPEELGKPTRAVIRRFVREFTTDQMTMREFGRIYPDIKALSKVRGVGFRSAREIAHILESFGFPQD